MKKFLTVTVLTLINLIGCSDSLSPTDNPDFSEMQFKITRSSGWGTSWSLMEIYKSGWVRMDGFVGDEWKEDIEISMNSSEMRIFRRLEKDFSLYGRYYKPDPWWTDQVYHNIILVREISDTTGVYDYGNCNLPGSLKKGIESAEGIARRAREN